MRVPKPIVYLDIWHIHLPLPAWVSLIQRLSGATLFVMLPLLVYLLHLSLTPTGYAQLLHWRQWLGVKVILVAMLWLYLQHFFAGIRFLLLDIQIAGTRRSAHILSAATLWLSTLLSLFIAWVYW